MEKIIMSYYGMESYSNFTSWNVNPIEGIFKVNVPNRFSENYREAICEVGKIISKVNDEDDVGSESEIFTEDEINGFVGIVYEYGLAPSIKSIFQVLGWKYDEIVTDMDFDVDRNE